MNMFEVFVKHDRIYFSIGNQSFQLAYEPEDEPEWSAGQVAEWYMDQLRHALSSLQSSDAQAEIAKRDERIAELEIRLSGFSDLTGLMQSSLEGDTSRISELLDQNEKQADEIERLKAVIAKCSAALETGLEVVDPPPERSCSCHLFPPCNDCVDYGGLREFFNFTEEALAAIKEEIL